MRIRKNGKVINLTESDLRRIVKRVLTEQDEDTDWNNAVNFCRDLEKWWEGSSNWFFNPKTSAGADTDYVKFFKRFQDTNDDEAAAAKAYQHMIMNKLNKDISEKNKYYPEILDWIERIVDQIDDYFQSPEELTLLGPNGETEYFIVDPEIDV